MKLFSYLLIFLYSFVYVSPYAYSGESPQVMVATAEALATKAALKVLRDGGNAVDAAIAAQWVLNVTEPQSSGIGGGGFFLYYDAAANKTHFYDGREVAPQQAYPQMFLDESNQPKTFWPDRISGGLPVGVPGTLMLMHRVYADHGSKKISFAELFTPAIKHALEGIPVSGRLHGYLEQEKKRLTLFDETKRLFFDSDGNVLAEGEILKQPDLAYTFELIAREGVEAFYEGAIAEDIVYAVKHASFNPGYMSREDLKAYSVIKREPVLGNYRGYDIISVGPPSSGATTLFQTLNILENFDLKTLTLKDQFKVISQAQRLAFENRLKYLGDSDFVDVPVEKLIDKSNAAEYARQIEQGIGNTAQEFAEEGSQTSHISIIDGDGNMVSFTTTIEYLFGSGMIVPGRGFFLNNELTDFAAEPHDESGELKANAARGGKRPLSSMTPSFVFKDEKPYMIVGSPGGSRIIGIVFNLLHQVIDGGKSLPEAMAAPRLINRFGSLELEAHFFDYPGYEDALEENEIDIKIYESFGNAQAILIKESSVEGASDPRGQGLAEGF